MNEPTTDREQATGSGRRERDDAARRERIERHWSCVGRRLAHLGRFLAELAQGRIVVAALPEEPGTRNREPGRKTTGSPPLVRLGPGGDYTRDYTEEQF